jgi:hypothetical protein
LCTLIGPAGCRRYGLRVLSGRLTQVTILLDWIAGQVLTPDNLADHLRTGGRGEEAAYLYLRKHIHNGRPQLSYAQPPRRN